jgi:hypothetical protein
MKDLELYEYINIYGGGGSDVGTYIIDKVGGFACWVKTSVKKIGDKLKSIDYSQLGNYSHGTYPGCFNN